MEELIAAGIVMGIVVGAVTGAVPAICGAIKGKLGLGIGGFFACLVSGAALGMILAIPVCAIFMFLIFKGNKKQQEQV